MLIKSEIIRTSYNLLILRMLISLYCYGLHQGSQTRGPPDVFVRPMTSLKLLKLLLKLLFL